MFNKITRFIDSIKWTNWRVKNASQIRHRIEKIKDLDKDCERFFPLFHLELAAILFNMGDYFDIASIFHSSSALELGLIIKLDSKISIEKKRVLGSMDLYHSIKEAKMEGLIDENNFKLAESVRLIRNCYVHSENTMAYLSRLRKQYQNRERIPLEYKTIEEQRIVRTILSGYQGELAIPDIEWCANIENVQSLEKRHQTFGRGFVKALAVFYSNQIDLKKIEREVARFSGLGFTTADASYSLNSSANILTYIGILPK
jgi:hypothetical protein